MYSILEKRTARSLVYPLALAGCLYLSRRYSVTTRAIKYGRRYSQLFQHSQQRIYLQGDISQKAGQLGRRSSLLAAGLARKCLSRVRCR